MRAHFSRNETFVSLSTVHSIYPHELNHTQPAGASGVWLVRWACAGTIYFCSVLAALGRPSTKYFFLFTVHYLNSFVPNARQAGQATVLGLPSLSMCPWLLMYTCRASASRDRIQRKTQSVEPYAGVDYNLTLCPLRSRLQHIYNGQPYVRVDLNLMPESTLSPCQGHWIWPRYGRSG